MTRKAKIGRELTSIAQVKNLDTSTVEATGFSGNPS